MGAVTEIWLSQSKETDNKLRWSVDVDGVAFQLYIPKAHVPLPWPSRIRVVVSHLDEPRPAALSRETDKERPIVAIVARKRDYTGTVRFAPPGEESEWEIGEPYIPVSLLPDPHVKALRIEVYWDRSSPDWTAD
jgi:hypothetical protein